jgi:dolichol kinase
MGHFVNKKYGKRKLVVRDDRSLEGAIAMFIFGMITCYLLIGFYWTMFYWQYPAAIAITGLELLITILVVSALTSVIETLSPSIYDNAFIPLGILITLVILGVVGFYTYPIFNI